MVNGGETAYVYGKERALAFRLTGCIGMSW